MPEFSEESLRKIAKEKVAKRLALQIHVAAYIGVNILLMVINLLATPNYLWFPWALCSWAIGLAMHVASYLIWLAGVTGGKVGALYHLTAYIAVNLYLPFVWWMTTPGGFMWFLIPLAGWAVALVIHFISIRPAKSTKSWMDQKVDAEIDKLRKQGVLPETEGA